MIINIKLKEYWASMMICVELRAQKLRNVYSLPYIICIEMLTLMCLEHTSNMSPVSEIEDYDY